MSHAAKLRVVLPHHKIQKLDLPLGIPETVIELQAAVRDTFGIAENFVLHYRDAAFGDEYFSLTSTGELKDKDTIKVVIVEPPTVTLTFTNSDNSFESASQISDLSAVSSAHTEVIANDTCGRSYRNWIH